MLLIWDKEKPAERTRRNMPVIALVLSTLAIWLIYWFVRMGGIDHVRGMFHRKSEEARRIIAREAERTAALRAVDDPRDAATILMLLIARTGHDPTREQIAVIEKTVRAVFGFDRDLSERMTQARFIASRADSFDHAAGFLSDLLKKRLSSDERHELIAMLEEVAGHDGPSEAQTEAIEGLKLRIGLAPPR
jgi:uncharacterized tellurite resistance protein B-like protein